DRVVAEAASFRLRLSAILAGECAPRSIHQTRTGVGLLAQGDQRTPRLADRARQHTSRGAQARRVEDSGYRRQGRALASYEEGSGAVNRQLLRKWSCQQLSHS